MPRAGRSTAKRCGHGRRARAHASASRAPRSPLRHRRAAAARAPRACHRDRRSELLEFVAREFAPGAFAAVAEISEAWTTRLDEPMERSGAGWSASGGRPSPTKRSNGEAKRKTRRAADRAGAPRLRRAPSLESGSTERAPRVVCVVEDPLRPATRRWPARSRACLPYRLWDHRTGATRGDMAGAPRRDPAWGPRSRRPPPEDAAERTGVPGRTPGRAGQDLERVSTRRQRSAPTPSAISRAPNRSE